MVKLAELAEIRIYCLDDLNVPVIVGIGDIGKMCGNDEWERGSPITKANSWIHLPERGGFYDEA
ncbi:stage V sporulation protein AE [Bacillus pacificus]